MNRAIAILVLLLITHGLVGGGSWWLAKTRYELRESKEATQALADDHRRSQRQDGVAGEHSEWQRKQAEVVAAEEKRVEQAAETERDWDSAAIPVGVRESLAQAAASIVAAGIPADGVQATSGTGAVHEPGAAPSLAGIPFRLGRLPPPASAPR